MSMWILWWAMTKKQHYMTENERYKLEGYLDTGMPVSWISQQMGFCRKTIYNEIKVRLEKKYD